MPQKVTLTGIPTTPPRIVEALMDNDSSIKVYAFEMNEGSFDSSKSLPVGSNIEFTIFVDEDMLNGAGLTEETLTTSKILVHGEIVMDLSMDICLGELGVTASHIKMIPEEQRSINFNIHIELEPEEEDTGEPKEFKLDLIVIPENQPPYKESTLEKLREYVKENGKLDMPLIINKKTRVLMETYPRYLVAKEFKLETVLVLFSKNTPKDSTVSEKPEEMDINLIKVAKSLPRPSESKLDLTREYVKANGKLDMPLVVNRKTNFLIETYARYIVAKEFGFTMVPVVFKGKEKEKKRKNKFSL